MNKEEAKSKPYFSLLERVNKARDMGHWVKGSAIQAWESDTQIEHWVVATGPY